MFRSIDGGMPLTRRDLGHAAGAVPSGTREAATTAQRHGLLPSLVVLLAGSVSVAVVVAVGSVARVPGSGLAALDPWVPWLLPTARLVGDLAAAATVGCLVAAAVLLTKRGFLTPAGYRWLRRATWPAVAWGASALLLLPGLLVEFLNTDLSQVSFRALVAFVRDTPFGGAQAAAAALATVVAVGSRMVLTTAGARVLLVLALFAVVPPVVAEYAEADGTRVPVAVAATGMVLHVLAALVWSGTLAALLLTRLSAGDLVTAVRRYSRAAPVLALVVGGSGLLTAAADLDDLGQWLQTAYGRVALLKVVAFAALVAVGWWHRRRTLPALASGQAGAFRRIAAVEILVFAVTFGLAVGLSRTPVPDPTTAEIEMSQPALPAPLTALS
ncbi:MAG: CopD family protein [Blastococcus sp.]|nr:CopD family protein [Blastococcus sp.]